MNNLVFVSRGHLNVSPTPDNFLKAFTSLGFKVHCICSSKDVNYTMENVTFHEIGNGSSKNPLGKLKNYYSFGNKAIQIIKGLKLDDQDIVWVSKVDTAIGLGRKLKKYRTVLTLLELHDQFPFWKWVTKNIIHSYSHIVFNEINRAKIAQVWYSLPYTPSVIPNKPFFHPQSKNLNIDDPELEKQITQIKKNKRIILYQGSLLADRDITPIVEAARGFSNKYVLVIMGKDPLNRMEDFRKINPHIFHIPFVTPPKHLQVTSWADIGIAFYDFDSLNSLYCAPNKIWEFSGFGIPVLGQDLLGLEYTIKRNKAGVCVNIKNTKEIHSGLKEIDSNYTEFSHNSKEYFQSVDFTEKVSEVLNKVSFINI